MSTIGVYTTGVQTPADDQSWLVNRISDGVKSVTIDATTLTKDEYFVSVDDTATVAYVKSGLPLARITASGKYGPYDPEATDGRETGVAGVLESLFAVSFNRGGMSADNEVAGMRYMGVIDIAKLPVVPDVSSFTSGLFVNAPADGEYTLLGGAAGARVKALALKTNADGKVTGGTATLTDNSTLAITVTTA